MAGWRASWRANSLLARSQTLLNHNKASEALPLCQEAVALAPQSAQAWVYLSWAYVDLNRSAEALEACDRALSIDPRNDWAWKNEGIALNQLKRYEEALEAAAHVSASSGKLAQRAGWVRTFALSRLGRFDAMRDEAEQLLSRDPANAKNWNWLGDALIGLKRYDEGLSMYTRSAELAPRDIYGLRAQASALYRLKRFPEAIAVYDRILASSDAISEDHNNKGCALHGSGRYSDAARQFTDALALDPGDAIVLHNLGSVYTRLQYYERALERHQRARAARGAGAYAWVSAAEDLIGLGWLYEALDHLKQASEIVTREASHDDDALISALRGIIHTRRGQFDEARAAFMDAQAADPEDNVVCWGFAGLLLALGETEKAASMIERSLTLDPFDARAWSLKAQILRAAGDESGAEGAEAHGQRMLSEQREQLAAWEREQAERAGD